MPGARRPSDHAELLRQVYAELRRLASWYLSSERDAHTWQTTDLVHEAYLKVSQRPDVPALGRQEFARVAAAAMRRTLVNHARDRRRLKRGGGAPALALGGHDLAAPVRASAIDLLALDDALRALESCNPRLMELVQLRYFGGQTLEDAAAALGLSLAQAKRDWQLARAWLHRRLGET